LDQATQNFNLFPAPPPYMNFVRPFFLQGRFLLDNHQAIAMPLLDVYAHNGFIILI
jgi:hypothetical protein